MGTVDNIVVNAQTHSNRNYLVVFFLLLKIPQSNRIFLKNQNIGPQRVLMNSHGFDISVAINNAVGRLGLFFSLF